MRNTNYSLTTGHVIVGPDCIIVPVNALFDCGFYVCFSAKYFFRGGVVVDHGFAGDLNVSPRFCNEVKRASAKKARKVLKELKEKKPILFP